MKKQLLSVVAGSTLLVIASSSFALSDTVVATGGPFTVSATITGTCTISVTPEPSLGSFLPTAGTRTALPAGQVDVDCQGSPNKVVLFNGGANLSGGTRRLADGTGQFINYRLYNGAVEVGDNNAPAGSGYASVAAIAQPGITYDGTAPSTYNITAEIDVTAGQPAGVYTDNSVIVTLAL